jgi:hypothetical protein
MGKRIFWAEHTDDKVEDLKDHVMMQQIHSSIVTSTPRVSLFLSLLCLQGKESDTFSLSPPSLFASFPTCLLPPPSSLTQAAPLNSPSLATLRSPPSSPLLSSIRKTPKPTAPPLPILPPTSTKMTSPLPSGRQRPRMSMGTAKGTARSRRLRIARRASCRRSHGGEYTC